jgi:thiol-disulfide isomerase/thioredoxin
VDAPGLRKLVEARRGHPVAVSFWSTWCAPCVKEFPKLVELASRRRDIAFVAVSLDEKEDQGSVEAFVAQRHPPFPVYLKAAGPDEAFINGVDKAWSGVLPALLVFDREGRKAALLEGEHTLQEVENALRSVTQ